MPNILNIKKIKKELKHIDDNIKWFNLKVAKHYILQGLRP